MRIRTIKPEWLEDEKMALASDAARVASVALILLSDDYGRGRANLVILGSRIFPGTPEKLPGTLAELCDMGFLTLYEVRGQKYFEIRNWSEHQRVDKPGKQRIPAPTDDAAKILETSEKVPGTLAPDLGPRTIGPRTIGPRTEDHDHVEDPPDPPRAKKKRTKGIDPAKIPERAHTLAQLLWDYRIENQPGSKFAKMTPAEATKTVIGWADVIRLTNSQDGHSWSEIESAIHWSQRDVRFWAGVIQSAKSLRANWDSMDGQRNRGANGVAVGRVEPSAHEDYPEGEVEL